MGNRAACFVIAIMLSLAKKLFGGDYAANLADIRFCSLGIPSRSVSVRASAAVEEATCNQRKRSSNKVQTATVAGTVKC